MRYRPSYHFVTTVTEPCPLCSQLKPEAEIRKGKRERYIYGAGWLSIQSCCDACWDKSVADHQVKADANTSFGY